MKLYGLDMRGEFNLNRVSILPPNSEARKGREIFVESESKRYFGDGTAWVDYANAESATTTDYYANNWSQPNLLLDNGRFSGTSAGMVTILPDGSYPFDEGALFTAYNGASFSQVGKFIFNNNDFGGSSGAMTQTTIDLMDAIGRTDNNARYGSEFRICGITAGSGTASPSTFPGGSRYLMTTQTIYPISGFSYTYTFCAWIRAVGGTIGIGAQYQSYFSIDGVEQSLAAYDISTSDGWVFVTTQSWNRRGYDSGFQRIYGNNGTVAHVALAAVFNGNVKPDPFYCPICTNS